MIPCARPSPQSKQHHYRFSRFPTGDRKCPYTLRWDAQKYVGFFIAHSVLLSKILAVAVTEMGDCLETIDMGRKLGAVPFGGAQSWPPSNTFFWAKAYLRTKWHLDPSSHLATIDMGQKLWGL